MFSTSGQGNKKSVAFSFLLAASVLVAGCQSTTNTKSKRLAIGDSRSALVRMMGNSTESSYVGQYEVLQYCSTGFAADDFVAAMIKDDRIAELKFYRNTSGTGFCESFYKNPSSFRWETIRLAREEQSRKRTAEQTAAAITKSLEESREAMDKKQKSEAKPKSVPLDLTYPEGPLRPDDVAVIVGNADYQKLGSDIPDVSPAYSDFASVRQWLIKAKGIREGNIIELKDATSAQLTSVFGSESSHKGKLYNWTKPGVSNVYVYYSGHGAPAGKTGTAFLVPSDANAESIELTGYPLSRLYSNLEKLPAISITVILEACFSGSAQAGTLISKASGLHVSPKIPDVPSKITVITAGAADQIASWEQDDSNSLFTKYFLTGLSGVADRRPYGNLDRKVSWQELKSYLEGTMTYFARRYYGRNQRAQFTIGN
jgi:hypothetical protein